MVFEVGGVIDLGGKSWKLREGRVTIAGQTAPNPGITLIRGGLEVFAQDVILQHLSIRPGIECQLIFMLHQQGVSARQGVSIDVQAAAHQVHIGHQPARDPGVDGRVSQLGHQLDQAGGPANGAPALPTAEAYRRWSTVMQNEFDALRWRLARGEAGLIAPYAATDPAEFFAVTSEYFFSAPDLLQQAYPQVYQQLSLFYLVLLRLVDLYLT